MALVRCVDCNKEISDQAPTCPSCGRPQDTASSLPVVQAQKRNVSFLLGLGIVVLPIIFAWFTLRKGHSVLSRVVAFSYMILSIIVGNAFSDYQAKSYQAQTAMSESISQDNAPQTATNHQKSESIPKSKSTNSTSSNESNNSNQSSYTFGQQNAIRSAKDYLAVMSFSRQGLIEQLSSDAGSGYSVKDATVAVDSLNVDWNEQAVKSAEEYLQTMGFSCKELIEQLSSDAGSGFTSKQANYAAKKVGACS